MQISCSRLFLKTGWILRRYSTDLLDFVFGREWHCQYVHLQTWVLDLKGLFCISNIEIEMFDILFWNQSSPHHRTLKNICQKSLKLHMRLHFTESRSKLCLSFPKWFLLYDSKLDVNQSIKIIIQGSLTKSMCILFVFDSSGNWIIDLVWSS